MNHSKERLLFMLTIFYKTVIFITIKKVMKKFHHINSSNFFLLDSQSTRVITYQQNHWSWN